MHCTAVQQNTVYEKFFMCPGTGKRKVQQPAASSVDHVVLGLPDEPESVASRAESPKPIIIDNRGRAGKATENTALHRPSRKHVPSINTAEADSAIFNHDIDKSGDDPHNKYFENFSDCAGNVRVARERRPVRKLHKGIKASTMDEDIFGVDLDQSGPKPHDAWQKDHDGRAGVSTKYNASRPLRRSNKPHPNSMGAILHGDDKDTEGIKVYQSKHKASAGLKYGEINTNRPYRGYGISQTASVDEVLFHRDQDKSAGKGHVEKFLDDKYTGYAGKLTAGSKPGSSAAGASSAAGPKASGGSFDAQVTLKPSQLDSSTTAALMSARAGYRRGSTASNASGASRVAPGEAPPAPAKAQTVAFKPQPRRISATSTKSSQTARSEQSEKSHKSLPSSHSEKSIQSKRSEKSQSGSTHRPSLTPVHE